jgi:hypothetical protein
MKRHGSVKIAATGLIALAMSGMTVGTSHAQSILGQATGHRSPFSCPGTFLTVSTRSNQTA